MKRPDYTNTGKPGPVQAVTFHCRTCGRVLDNQNLSAYQKDKLSKRGLHGHCEECVRTRRVRT